MAGVLESTPAQVHLIVSPVLSYRRPILFHLRIFLVIALAGCWIVRGTVLAQVPKPLVKVHTPGRYILSLPFQIAEEQGFYKDESVNVEFVVMPTGAGVQALIAGDVDASQILG